MTYQVSTTPFPRNPDEDHQIVSLELPPTEVLTAIGQAVVLFAQLEHLLKVIHRRTDGEIKLKDVVELRLSLGTILNGSHALGKEVQFEGLLGLANRNDKLKPIVEDLIELTKLVTTRNAYVHNGIGKKSNGSFIFLNSGKPISPNDMVQNLNAASDVIRRLLPKINAAIPRSR